jgi:hypothetical protein
VTGVNVSGPSSTDSTIYHAALQEGPDLIEQGVLQLHDEMSAMS